MDSDVQGRVRSLQDLYLKAIRVSQDQDPQKQTLDSIIDAASGGSGCDGVSAQSQDASFEEPRNIVPALQEIAALRRERETFKAQVITLLAKLPFVCNDDCTRMKRAHMHKAIIQAAQCCFPAWSVHAQGVTVRKVTR